MPEPRQLRGFALFEIAAVIAIAALPWPEPLPAVLPLVVVATLARYLRRRSWAEVAWFRGRQAAIGAIAGAVAFALAVLAGAPLIEQVSGRGIEWSAWPIVRGSPSQLVIVLVIVAVTAIAAELALRGWLVERVVELAGRPALAVVCGAVAEALVVPGDLAIRLGAGCFGVGLGAIYLAAGRTVVPAVCARLAFAVIAVMLEAMQVIG